MGYTTDFEGSLKVEPPAPELVPIVNEEMGDAKGRPNDYNQWELNEAGTMLAWDGGEKFYDYVEWLKFLIGRVFKPMGHVLNGEVMWSGEDTTDVGRIRVVDNVVKVSHAEFVFNDD